MLLNLLWPRRLLTRLKLLRVVWCSSLVKWKFHLKLTAPLMLQRACMYFEVLRLWRQKQGWQVHILFDFCTLLTISWYEHGIEETRSKNRNQMRATFIVATMYTGRMKNGSVPEHWVRVSRGHQLVEWEVFVWPLVERDREDRISGQILLLNRPIDLPGDG
jgi:hypothetical protein